MTLAAGHRIGPYEVVAAIGAGGMGEVYRATDTNLKRAVAIKVLPASVAADVERLARFQREAEVLAALNHPNIAHIHGLERTADLTALVMELVEGDDLSVLIARGPIPLAEALPLAKQIADALEAAHELGIIHRDLKPANVKVRDDGVVKVLDFGLAKALAPDGANATAEAMNSPTLTNRATQLGMILGTAAYMAPEQAKGRVVDCRADIWAFGVVLFEMLTGRRLFEAEDVSETLAAVLTRDVSMTSLPVALPARLRALVRDCLIRDPKQRLRDIGDARLVLDRIIAGAPDDSMAPATAAIVPAGLRNRERVAWIAAATLAVALLVTATMTVMRLREAAPVVDPIQFTIDAPEKSPFDGTVPQFAVSPDGRQVAFVAARKGALVLWVRSLATGVATPLMGTEWAQHPFWSPDSRFIGFFAGGKLKKVPVGGGIPAILCSAPTDRGGAWTGDNIILVSPTVNGPLQRVSADGTLTPVTELGKDEWSHRWPAFLPDGRHFLYFVGTGDGLMGQIRVGSLDSKEAAPVTASHSNGLYAAGHVLFVRDGTLMALPFDPDARRSTGDAFPVAERVFTDSGAYAAVSASAANVLTHVHGSARDIGQLTWFDAAGTSLGTVGEPGEYYNVSLSRDERRAAVSLLSGSPPNRDIRLIDLVPPGARPRFTSDPGVDILPIWSRDDSQIAFGSNRGGPINIYVKASNLSGQEEPVSKSKSVTANYLTDWSLDGRSLLYTDQTAQTGWDVWVLPLAGDQKPEPFVHTQFNEDNAVFSPDGQWVAYDSDESGRREVYVTHFPRDSGGYHMVSGSGGWQPMWQGNNRLFFLSLDATLMSASISTAKAISSGPPETHFPTGASPPAFGSANRRQYAVAKGGTRFLVIVPEHNPTPINVVVNWLGGLKK